MHFVNHNFTDIDFETKHMSRIEKTVYFDLRSLYLSEEKPIDGSDMDLLQRRLSVTEEDEKEALAFVLKDKFSKAGKLFKRAEWDKIIKDYKFHQISIAVGDMSKRLRAAGVTIEANAGMSAIRELYIQRFGGDKLTRITNKANVMTNEINAKNAAITKNHEPLTNNHKPVSESDAHTNTGELIVDKFNHDSVDNSFDANQPVPVELPQQTQPSANQPATKADQIRDQRADDIENWEVPTIDEMRGELFKAGKMMQLTEDQYALHVGDFKAHYAEQALLGKPITTESNRKAKLRKWLAGEIDKQAANQSRQEKAKGTFNIDNEDWSGSTGSQSRSNSDMPDVFHPSHITDVPADNAPLFLNGCKRSPLPGMTNPETLAHVDRYVQPGEASVAAYDRLLNQMQEAV